MATTLIYGEHEYLIPLESVDAILDAVKQAVNTENASWLAVGADGGHVVHLLVGPGVNISIVTDDAPQGYAVGTLTPRYRYSIPDIASPHRYLARHGESRG